MAEDQTFIALDLALAVEDAGGKVVGPAASCEAAMLLLSNGIVGAAILDVNLVDGDCSALVEVLVDLCVPFIIHTAVDLPPALSARFSGLVVQIKPCPPANLVARLESMMAGHERAVVISLSVVRSRAGHRVGLRAKVRGSRPPVATCFSD